VSSGARRPAVGAEREAVTRMKRKSMELGEFYKSIEDLTEDLSANKAKKAKLRIVQHIYDGDMKYLRTDEKEIVGMEHEPDNNEIILTVVERQEEKE
jgi:hypothetical protein